MYDRQDNISVEQVDEEDNACDSGKVNTQAFLYEDTDLGTDNFRVLLLYDDDDDVDTKAKGGHNYKQSDLSSINWNEAGL